MVDFPQIHNIEVIQLNVINEALLKSGQARAVGKIKNPLAMGSMGDSTKTCFYDQAPEAFQTYLKSLGRIHQRDYAYSMGDLMHQAVWSIDHAKTLIDNRLKPKAMTPQLQHVIEASAFLSGANSLIAAELNKQTVKREIFAHDLLDKNVKFEALLEMLLAPAECGHTCQIIQGVLDEFKIPKQLYPVVGLSVAVRGLVSRWYYQSMSTTGTRDKEAAMRFIAAQMRETSSKYIDNEPLRNGAMTAMYVVALASFRAMGPPRTVSGPMHCDLPFNRGYSPLKSFAQIMAHFPEYEILSSKQFLPLVLSDDGAESPRSLNHLQSVRQRIDEDSTETTKWQQRYPVSTMKKSVSGTCELDVHGALRDGIARRLDDETIGRLGLGTPARQAVWTMASIPSLLTHFSELTGVEVPAVLVQSASDAALLYNAGSDGQGGDPNSVSFVQRACRARELAKSTRIEDAVPTLMIIMTAVLNQLKEAYGVRYDFPHQNWWAKPDIEVRKNSDKVLPGTEKALAFFTEACDIVGLRGESVEIGGETVTRQQLMVASLAFAFANFKGHQPVKPNELPNGIEASTACFEKPGGREDRRKTAPLLLENNYFAFADVSKYAVVNHLVNSLQAYHPEEPADQSSLQGVLSCGSHVMRPSSDPFSHAIAVK